MEGVRSAEEIKAHDSPPAIAASEQRPLPTVTLLLCSVCADRSHMVLSQGLLPQIPQEPPRAVTVLPGLRLTRAVSARALILPLSFLGLFALMPLIIMLSDRGAKLAIRRTHTVSGRVEQLEAGRGCTGDSTEVRYSFSTGNGVVYRGQDTVCTGTPYSSIRSGDTVPVVYMEDDPAVNAIPGARGTDSPPVFIFLIFPLFGLVFFLPFFWPRYSQLLHDRKLFRTGTLRHGAVAFAVTRQGTCGRVGRSPRVPKCSSNFG